MRSWLIVAALLAIGLAARAPRLTESLWYDEIAAWRDYASKGPAWIVTHYFDPANHIGHTLVSWASFSLLDRLGITAPEIALRLPALLFSLGSIVAVWGLAGRACRGLGVDEGDPPAEPGANGEGCRRMAVVAGVLAATLPVSVLEGVEARGYSMMIAFSALATWTILSAIQRERSWKWMLYILCCALGVWSHLMMVWVPIGHAAWLMWALARGGGQHTRKRIVTLRGLGAVALAAILTLALYAPVLDDLLRIRGQFRAAEGDEPGVFGVEGLHALLQLGGSWYWWAAAPGMAVAVVGFAAGMRRATTRAALVLSLIGLPIMIVALAVGRSWMYARFALFALPGAILAMALGIDALWRWKRPIGAAALAIVIAVSLADLVVRPPRQPLREAANIVRNNWSDDDRLLVIGLKHQAMEVYAGQLDPTYSLDLGADLEAKLHQTRPTWVIILYPQRVGEAKIRLLEDGGMTEIARLPGWIDWGRGDVSVWRVGGS
ncbi:MAG: glycosyltransferase family 39 protein [Planctomycetota bacterium]|nr:glycosyltransferase family 39 protein [Planctomycetota bacterium]